MGRDTYSRQNVRVLTSVDYSKMCDEDKTKENESSRGPRLRAELDQARRQGARLLRWRTATTRSNYAKTPLLEHLLAGMQYALGDLQADDSPSVKGGTK